MNQANNHVENAVELVLANEISIEEITTRENAASDTFMCCIVNVAF